MFDDIPLSTRIGLVRDEIVGNGIDRFNLTVWFGEENELLSFSSIDWFVTNCQTTGCIAGETAVAMTKILGEKKVSLLLPKMRVSRTYRWSEDSTHDQFVELCCHWLGLPLVGEVSAHPFIISWWIYEGRINDIWNRQELFDAVCSWLDEIYEEALVKEALATDMTEFWTDVSSISL